MGLRASLSIIDKTEADRRRRYAEYQSRTEWHNQLLSITLLCADKVLGRGAGMGLLKGRHLTPLERRGIRNAAKLFAEVSEFVTSEILMAGEDSGPLSPLPGFKALWESKV